MKTAGATFVLAGAGSAGASKRLIRLTIGHIRQGSRMRPIRSSFLVEIDSARLGINWKTEALQAMVSSALARV